MHTLTPGRRRAAMLALAVGSFGLGLSEFAVVGLLPDLARDLLPSTYARSVPDAVARASWTISIYALGVVAGAPTIAALTARMPRRRLVAALLGLMVVGTAASALAPTFGLVLAGRFVGALAHGAYFGAAGMLAASMLGAGNEARGYAVVLGGLTVASVIGVPSATWFGQLAGWRVAYLAVAGVFALALVAVLATVPPDATPSPGSARSELAALRSPQLWLVAVGTAVGFGGFFAVNSYVAPVTIHVAGLSEAAVPWVLAVMGIGMTLGTLAGGFAADRHLRRSILGGIVALITTAALFGVIARYPVGLFLGVFLVGAASLFLAPALQTRLIEVAAGTQLMGAAVNQSATNAANSIGAALGGAVIAAGWGYLAPAWVGVALGVTGLALALVSFRRDDRAHLALAPVDPLG